MRNTHVWKSKTEDGERREVRAEKFGKRWRLQAKVKGDEEWTYYEVPLLTDLVDLREVLWRKYQRKHLSWEDIVAIDALLEERRANVSVSDENGSEESTLNG